MSSLPHLPHYTVTARIGAGGMGEVYRARDARLDRDVAVKMLPDDLTADSDRHARFHREAKLLAAFSHPNVAAIHALEEHEGRHYLVMELVDGEDLGARLDRGPLTVRDALDIARQIAAAMQAAHDKGIVHRDLKPQNVMLDAEGRVKVLDFGLAKLLLDDPDAEAPGSGSWQTLPPTLTSDGTRQGVILGTAAFMSPEQARGVPVDRRADVWAFGCVLYAMLTGNAPFPGETVSDTIAAVLKSEPGWTALPADTPPRVRDLLDRCLTKDLHGRLRDMGDARIEIERILAGRDQDSEGAGAALSAARGLDRRSLLLAVLLSAVLAPLAWLLMDQLRGPAPTAAAARPAHLSFVVPAGYEASNVEPSPDGSLMAVVAAPLKAEGERGDPQLHLRALDDDEMRPVPGAENLVGFAFTPDSRWLVLMTKIDPKSSRLKLSRVPVDLSAPPLVLQQLPDGAAPPVLCLPNGDLVVATTERGLMRVPADPAAAARRIEIKADTPPRLFINNSPATVFPDGRRILGYAEVWNEEGYRQDICSVDLESGEFAIILPDAGSPRLSPEGDLLFTRGGTLLAAPFDAGAGRLTGAAVALRDGLRRRNFWSHGWFELGAEGSLFYMAGGAAGDERQFMLLDADFREIGPWSDERRPLEEDFAISRDGSRVAVVIAGIDGVFDTWVGEIDRPGLTLFAEAPQKDLTPMQFSPDGRRLYYLLYSNEGFAFFSRDLAGGDPVPLPVGDLPSTASYPTSDITADGRYLIQTLGRDGRSDLMAQPTFADAEGRAEPILLLEDSTNGRLSPDGRWLLYETDVSGRLEVCVRRFSADLSLGPVIRISGEGGADPAWHRSPGGGDPQILFVADGRYYVAGFDGERGQRVGRPVRLGADKDRLFAQYVDMKQLPDGRYLGVKMDGDEGSVARVEVVLGFTGQQQ